MSEAALIGTSWFNGGGTSNSSPVVKTPRAYRPFSPYREMVLVSTDTLGSKTAALLGDNGVKRFEEFKRYKDGWDHGYGRPLSNRSVAVMEFFINKFSDSINEASLFFTRDGNLQLGWEDNSGNSIELEFFPDRIEYFIESLDMEGEIEVKEADVAQLISYLNPI